MQNYCVENRVDNFVRIMADTKTYTLLFAVMRLGKKPEYGVKIEGKLRAVPSDDFWGTMKRIRLTESELIREAWRYYWENYLTAEDRRQIKKELEINPSPRMVEQRERDNKMKCE